MKQLIPFLIPIAVLMSCSKDRTARISSANEVNTMANATTVRFTGGFVPTTGIAVKGSAKIFLKGTQYALALDSFQVSAGPDLKVYLSKNYTPSEYINLGALSNNPGGDVYDIPVGVDFSIYKYVLIHCQQYNHLFAIATLTP